MYFVIVIIVIIIRIIVLVINAVLLLPPNPKGMSGRAKHFAPVTVFLCTLWIYIHVQCRYLLSHLLLDLRKQCRRKGMEQRQA